MKERCSICLKKNYSKCSCFSTFRGDFGLSNIIRIEIIQNQYLNTEEYRNLRMRFNENNDCVFVEIWKGIKDITGYKNYNVVKIKKEFVDIGIDIKDGVNFKDIEKWIDYYDHSINVYLFGADLVLKCVKKGNNPHKQKVPNLIFVYNNGHCFQIFNEEIKKKITYGNKKDINDLNPLSTLKFDMFKKYSVISFDDLKDLVEQDHFKTIEDDIILVETSHTFCEMIHYLINKDNTEINFIDYKKEGIYYKDKIIVRVNDYHKRNLICEKLNEKLGVINFKYCNQSYSKIGFDLFKIVNGIDKMQKSHYNKEVLELVDNFYPEPIHFGSEKRKIKLMDYFTKSEEEVIANIKTYKYKNGGDYSKSYSLGMYRYFRNAQIPVLSIFDNFVKKEFIINDENFKGLNNGCYLIKGFIYKGIYLDTSLIPLFIIEEFMKKGIVLECLGFVECSRVIYGVSFSEFVDKTFELLEMDELKKVINSFTGLMNKKYSCINKGFITQDDQVANNALLDGYDLTFEGNGENRIYIAKCKDQERINGDYNIIYHSIILSGWLNVFEIIDKIDETCNGDFKITGINTDAVYFLSNKYIELKVDNTDLKSVLKQPIKMNNEEYREKKFKHKDFRNFILDKEEWKLNDKESYYHDQVGGIGKTYKAIKENEDCEILGISYENSSVDNLRNYCVEFGVINSRFNFLINFTGGSPPYFLRIIFPPVIFSVIFSVKFSP